jgi:hypothetical protein
MLFLVEYDRKAGQLVSLSPYSCADRHAAQEAHLCLELKLRTDGVEHEVVLLEAASEGALRKTHRRYFETLEALAEPH